MCLPLPMSTHFNSLIHTRTSVRQKTHILCMWHPSQVRLSSISSPWSLDQPGYILWLQQGEAGLTETLRSATGNTPTPNFWTNAQCSLIVALQSLVLLPGSQIFLSSKSSNLTFEVPLFICVYERNLRFTCMYIWLE